MELLIRYLDGELSGDEAGQLEIALREDPAMRDALDRIKATRRALRTYVLDEKVKSVRQAMLAEEGGGVRRIGTSRFIYRRVSGIAAALILGFSLLGFYEYRQLTPGRLFAHSFEPYESAVMRGADTSALQAKWQEGRMAEVTRIFGRLEHPGSKDLFLAANAYLALGQPQEAIRLFLSLRQLNAEAGTHYFQDDTEYYLAMSYLAAGLPKSAMPLLDRIHEDPSNLYHHKVNALFVWKLHHLH